MTCFPYVLGLIAVSASVQAAVLPRTTEAFGKALCKEVTNRRAATRACEATVTSEEYVERHDAYLVAVEVCTRFNTVKKTASYRATATRCFQTASQWLQLQVLEGICTDQPRDRLRYRCFEAGFRALRTDDPVLSFRGSYPW